MGGFFDGDNELLDGSLLVLLEHKRTAGNRLHHFASDQNIGSNTNHVIDSAVTQGNTRRWADFTIT